jgi:ubiquinone/menaquinone biosynthesis C-methylase UbiE
MEKSTADGYERENIQQEVAERDTFTVERYRQFARQLPDSDDAHVLDVGCSTGRGGIELARSRPNTVLWGLDVVQRRLDELPAVYSNRIRGLSTAIPIDDEMIDVILAGEFLEHLRPQDVDPTIYEFHRILKIGGRVILTTPNPNSIKLRMLRSSVYGPGHLTQHHASVLRTRLRMHGFKNVKVRGSGKASRYIGERIPFLPLYGSYMIRADKY